jgi:hypothetical protein
MRRLYLQIYLAFVASLLLLGLLFSLAWLWLTPTDGTGLSSLASVGEKLLPAPGTPAEELEAALAELSRRFHLSLTLSDASGAELASAGDPVPRIRSLVEDLSILAFQGAGPHHGAPALRRVSGSWFAIGSEATPSRVLLSLLLAATAVAVGAYPLVRERFDPRLQSFQSPRQPHPALRLRPVS